MKLIEVNDLVIRVNSSKYDNGRLGCVVEVGTVGKNLGRYRVMWYHANGTCDKRTWVRADFLQLRSEVRDILGDIFADPK